MFTGTGRLCHVLWYMWRGTKRWIPQRHIEAQFRDNSCYFVWRFSWQHLWHYSVVAALGLLALILLAALGHINWLSYILVFITLGLLLLLPVYCAITATRAPGM